MRIISIVPTSYYNNFNFGLSTLQQMETEVVGLRQKSRQKAGELLLDFGARSISLFLKTNTSHRKLPELCLPTKYQATGMP